MNPITVLWIYIALLVAGGLMGFIKAKSKMSLIMSLVFALPLALCALGIIKSPTWLADVLLVFLLIFFGLRYAKSKKFMPNGMMTILSALALILRNVRF